MVLDFCDLFREISATLWSAPNKDFGSRISRKIVIWQLHNFAYMLQVCTAFHRWDLRGKLGFSAGFRETLRSDIDVGRFQRPEARSKSMNLILVSHGLTLRVFLMRWYKWTVEQFEGLWNFGNTGMLVMQLGPGGRCILMYQSLCHHKLCIGVLVWHRFDGCHGVFLCCETALTVALKLHPSVFQYM